MPPDAQPVALPTPSDVELLRARVQIFSLQKVVADLSAQLATRDLAAAEAMVEGERVAAKERWEAENGGASETVGIKIDAQGAGPREIDHLRAQIPIVALSAVQAAASRGGLDGNPPAPQPADPPKPKAPSPTSGAAETNGERRRRLTRKAAGHA